MFISSFLQTAQTYFIVYNKSALFFVDAVFLPEQNPGGHAAGLAKGVGAILSPSIA
jgi:hypothetical protein